jgi:uncharacterized membrane protein HdeD (DUF308 family)
VSNPAVTPQVGGPAIGTRGEAAVAAELGRWWWMWLVTGTLWVVASLVILQFDSASITTVGIIVGCMFVFSGMQQIALATAADHLRWLWALFGGLFLICGVICFINPKATFAGLADILGFLFLVVGVWWTIGAFLERQASSLWWLSLLAGISMIVLAFWTSGQFFIHRAYTLLVFAGIWALMQGVTDMVRAFAMRRVRDEVV